MGSVFNRGTKDRPLWYVQYREGGRWKMANSRQTSKAKALRFLHLAEERVAQGKVGISRTNRAPCSAPWRTSG